MDFNEQYGTLLGVISPLPDVELKEKLTNTIRTADAKVEQAKQEFKKEYADFVAKSGEEMHSKEGQLAARVQSLQDRIDDATEEIEADKKYIEQLIIERDSLTEEIDSLKSSIRWFYVWYVVKWIFAIIGFIFIIAGAIVYSILSIVFSGSSKDDD